MDENDTFYTDRDRETLGINTERNGQRTSRFRRAAPWLGLVVLLAIVIPFANTNNNSLNTAPTPLLPSAGGNIGPDISDIIETTIQDISENPSLYIGKKVAVSGEISDYTGEQSTFLLNDSDSHSTIRIVSAQMMTDQIEEGTEVAITGTVQEFVSIQNEDAGLQNRYVIVSDSILITDR